MEKVLRECIWELGLERNPESEENYSKDEQDVITDYIDSLSWNTNYFLKEIARKLEEKGFYPYNKKA